MATTGFLVSETVQVPVHRVTLEGELRVPEGARGLVMFAHGSGSSRFSPRNQAVARVLERGQFGTLLLDLLTRREEAIDERTAHLRFDIRLLADRLVDTTDWLQAQPVTGTLALGYFGASTGAGAALVAAAQRPDAVRAVVSRGGRPDLAVHWLERVEAPTLLIVGGDDDPVIALNQQAYREMRAAPDRRIEVIPGASHLFSEPGALEQVAELARGWFELHLGAAARAGQAPHA